MITEEEVAVLIGLNIGAFFLGYFFSYLWYVARKILNNL